MWKLRKVAQIIAYKRPIHTATQLKQLACKNFDISEEVNHGLRTGSPIVALESTIITHGMPYPDNLQCALDVESIVREQGAIPATIAVIGGKVTVGLSHAQIAALADTAVNKSVKTSRRDFPYVLSEKLNGGTTVSGTIIVASQVGIPVFVTGGIGGVHRQGESTLDISADLTELGRNSIAVVSSGVKSILDIPRTLEYLETQGVFVAAYGQTSDFPAFYSRKSGSYAPYNVTSAQQAAQIISANLALDLKSAMLFAVPVPEADALDEELLQQAIEQALEEAKTKGIRGKHITPFLLNAVAKITGGRSLQTNMALIKNNAKVGVEIAVELSRIRSQETASQIVTSAPVIIGGSVLDLCASLTVPDILGSQPAL
ncbi:uncharacterized protein CBL_06841 [Carabus blaptoides fortunei]